MSIPISLDKFYIENEINLARVSNDFPSEVTVPCVCTVYHVFTIISYDSYVLSKNRPKIVRPNIRVTREIAGQILEPTKRVLLCQTPFLVCLFVSTKYYGPQNALQICLVLFS